MVRKMNSSYSGDTDKTAGLQTLVGYHWMWDSGLNASIAFGGGRDMSTDDHEDYGGDDSFVNGYLRFGYAF
jgi:hypothetical protein